VGVRDFFAIFGSGAHFKGEDRPRQCANRNC